MHFYVRIVTLNLVMQGLNFFNYPQNINWVCWLGGCCFEIKRSLVWLMLEGLKADNCYLDLFGCWWWPPEQVWEGCYQSGDTLALCQVNREWLVSPSILSHTRWVAKRTHCLKDNCPCLRLGWWSSIFSVTLIWEECLCFLFTSHCKLSLQASFELKSLPCDTVWHVLIL